MACAFTGLFDRDEATPTPQIEDNSLNFLVPLYGESLAPGESVPRTQMTYIGRQGDAYQVTIDGLTAQKRIGDSFLWRGVIAPGVVGKYSLRLTPSLFGGELSVTGPVEISILNPSPIELTDGSEASGAELHLTGIPLETTVAAGESIPGTSLVYERLTEQGAELSGTAGYPYRALGDSLIWSGRLRSEVTVRYSLRVATLDEDRMRLLGTAELWIGAP
jgi:hypothetical protein